MKIVTDGLSFAIKNSWWEGGGYHDLREDYIWSDDERFHRFCFGTEEQVLRKLDILKGENKRNLRSMSVKDFLNEYENIE